MYYFAYGSNMNPKRMRQRGVRFTARMPARLPGYRLVFNKVTSAADAGYANVVPDPEGVVEGALYEIEDDEDLAILDLCEAHPDHYQRERVDVYRADGTRVRAVVYVANRDEVREGLRPTRGYLNHLLAGRDVLSDAYYEQLRKVETSGEKPPRNRRVQSVLVEKRPARGRRFRRRRGRR